MKKPTRPMRARPPIPNPTTPPMIGPRLDELFDGEFDVVGVGPKESVAEEVFVVVLEESVVMEKVFVIVLELSVVEKVFVVVLGV